MACLICTQSPIPGSGNPFSTLRSQIAITNNPIPAPPSNPIQPHNSKNPKKPPRPSVKICTRIELPIAIKNNTSAKGVDDCTRIMHRSSLHRKNVPSNPPKRGRSEETHWRKTVEEKSHAPPPVSPIIATIVHLPNESTMPGE
jgi:hypothetical protein